MAGGKGTVVAALDVGSNKVSCFIARLSETGGVKVEGIGHQLSEGVRGGAIVDMEKAGHSIRAAIDQAERMAGATIRKVLVNLSAGMPDSEAVHVEVKIAGHQVGEADIRRALLEGRRQAESYDREVVHAIPVTYSIDGTRGIRDPRGMHGNLLGVDIHVVTAASGPLHNLRLCLGQGHLGIAGIVVSSYAAGLSTLVEDERDMGATVIDMGGGTTSVGVFMEGDLVFSDVIPLGGQHITQDIARGLLTPLKHAERLKSLHGSALRSASDDRESISVVHVGEHGKQSQIMPRAMLTGVIQPRVEEIFEAVRDRLISTGFDRAAGKRVVLTGGASQLQGVDELAFRLLDKQVRLGRPIPIGGLAESTVGPAFASCAGLLVYAAQGYAQRGKLMAAMLEPERPGSTMARVGQWFREHF